MNRDKYLYETKEIKSECKGSYERFSDFQKMRQLCSCQIKIKKPPNPRNHIMQWHIKIT